VEKAREIFREAHREDPNWPLEKRVSERSKVSKEAWKIKRERDKAGWTPPNAKPMGSPGVAK
jgi:hypothetical protein